MPQRRSIADLRRSQAMPASSSASIRPPSVRMPRSSPAAAAISFHSAMLRGASGSVWAAGPPSAGVSSVKS